MGPALLSRACHPVLVGKAEPFIAAADDWDTFALVRYRSRRSFLETISDPAFASHYEYKLAAITKAIAYPVEGPLYIFDLRLLFLLLLGFLAAAIDPAMSRRAPQISVTGLRTRDTMKSEAQEQVRAPESKQT
jgi:hypothetical protein